MVEPCGVSDGAVSAKRPGPQPGARGGFKHVLRSALGSAAALAALGLALLAPLRAPARSTATAPEIDAKAAIVIDASSGEALFRKNSRERLPIASTTKLMTAQLTLDRGDLRARLAAPRYRPTAAESLINLRPGEQLTERDLLYGMLLASANDAAQTLAVRLGGTARKFVAEMNARAAQLGLTDTHYSNPVGLDELDNYSSAFDLAKLARTLRANAQFRKIVALPRATLASGSTVRHITTRNTLLLNHGFVDGIKTGHTLEAGWCLVGSATRKGIHLISVVLGAPTEAARDADSLELLDYGFDQYTTLVPVRGGTRLGETTVRYRDERVPLFAPRTLRVTVRRGMRVTTQVLAPATVGHTERGAPLGRVRIASDGRTIETANLQPTRSVAAAGTALIAYKKFRWPLTVVALAAILGTVLWRRHRNIVRRRALVDSRRRAVQEMRTSELQEPPTFNEE